MDGEAPCLDSEYAGCVATTEQGKCFLIMPDEYWLLLSERESKRAASAHVKAEGPAAGPSGERRSEPKGQAAPTWVHVRFTFNRTQFHRMYVALLTQVCVCVCV